MTFLMKSKLAALLFFVLSFSTPVLASPLTEGNIVSFSDVTIKPDEQVKSVLVIGGNATIAGYVADEVVVINGNVFLASSAKVKDHVIVLGGKIAADDGASVREGYFQYGGDFFALSSILTASLLIAILWLAQFMVTVALLTIPFLTVWLRQRLIEEISSIVKDNLIRTFFLGILAIVAGLVILAIFTLSMIGIPIALVFLLLMLVMMALGLGATCTRIGDKISGYINVKGQNKYFNVLVGSIFSSLLFNIPFIGLLVLCLTLSVGFGGVLLIFFTKK